MKSDNLFVFIRLNSFETAAIFACGVFAIMLGVPWWLVLMAPFIVGALILFYEFIRR